MHTSPATQRVSLGDRGETTHVSATLRAQGKTHTGITLASFGQQCRAGHWSTSTGNDPRASRVLAAVKTCRESHFQAAAEIDMSNTAKARRTPRRHAEPIDTPKPITVHCTALRRQGPAPSDRIQAQGPPTRKHHRALTQPHPQGQALQLSTKDQP